MLTATRLTLPPAAQLEVPWPALESGMTLSGAEFDRRYELRPDIKKAELIQGVVYVASPVRITEHATPDSRLVGWLTNYAVLHRDTQSANNGTVRLSLDDHVQPDAMLWYIIGGTAKVGSDSYMDGAPELVVEIAASSASIDLGVKLRSYQKAGVQEYVVWATEEKRITWFSLEEGLFIPLAPGADGWTESRVFPGLRLHIARLLAGDGAVILPGAA